MKLDRVIVAAPADFALSVDARSKVPKCEYPTGCHVLCQRTIIEDVRDDTDVALEFADGWKLGNVRYDADTGNLLFTPAGHIQAMTIDVEDVLGTGIILGIYVPRDRKAGEI